MQYREQEILLFLLFSLSLFLLWLWVREKEVCLWVRDRSVHFSLFQSRPDFLVYLVL